MKAVERDGCVLPGWGGGCGCFPYRVSNNAVVGAVGMKQPHSPVSVVGFASVPFVFFFLVHILPHGE